ncbi:MAG: hypothetical protein JSR30_00205 [Proteobacteria bacterium]|nr:hypothetical protein [Pseudomonadota bacterium]
MTHEELNKADDLLRPVRYAGAGPCGFVFFKRALWEDAENFPSLESAYAEYGDRIIIEGSSIQSPRFHAGYNAALFGKPYQPQTRISDGAPRELSMEEIKEYDFGYLHGVQMRPKTRANGRTEGEGRI